MIDQARGHSVKQFWRATKRLRVALDHLRSLPEPERSLACPVAAQMLGGGTVTADLPTSITAVIAEARVALHDAKAAFTVPEEMVTGSPTDAATDRRFLADLISEFVSGAGSTCAFPEDGDP